MSLGELHYSKATEQPGAHHRGRARATRRGERVEDLPQGVRVSSEYPGLTERFFADRGIEADIRLSYGATEAKVPDIVDCIVDITETGRAIRAAGLRIIDTILTSYTELVANPASFADPAKAHAMRQVQTLLEGVLEARGKVLVKLNVQADQLDAVIALLPSMKSPTVNELYAGQGYAVEGVVPKAHHQRADPGPEGPRRHRHHRAARSRRSCTDGADAPDRRARPRWRPGRPLSGVVRGRRWRPSMIPRGTAR